jgi:circadian clock protein KaiC
MHLATMYAEISAFNPSLVIVDPVTNLTSAGSDAELNAMLMRLIDFLKARQVTALFTSLTSGGEALEQTAVGVSSLMDTWLLVRIIDVGGERNRGLYILKARGMAHSNQVREFVMTNHGVELLDVYVGPHGVLTGSARYAQEAKERAEELARQQEFEARRSLLDRRRAAVEAQIAALRAELDSEEYDLQSLLVQKNLRDTAIVKDRQAMAKLRKADSSEDHPNDSPAAGETAGKGAPQW